MIASRTITAWIRPNLWNEFQGNPTTSFTSATGFVPFHADLGGLWGEINAGVSSQVTANADAFCQCFLPEPVRRWRLRLHRKGWTSG